MPARTTRKQEPPSPTPARGPKKKTRGRDLEDPLDRLAEREDFLDDPLTFGDGNLKDGHEAGARPTKYQQPGDDKLRKRPNWKLLPMRRPRQSESKSPSELAKDPLAPADASVEPA